MPGGFFMAGMAGIILPATPELDRNNIQQGMIVLTAGLIVNRKAQDQRFTGTFPLVRPGRFILDRIHYLLSLQP